METTTARPAATVPATDPAQDAITSVLADLAAVADLVVTAVTAADSGQVRMATAGSILASIDRLTAGVVAVLSSVSHRGVIADEGISAAAWLRTFAARTAADERMLSNTVDRLADMPTISEWFSSGDVSWPVVRGVVAAVRNLTREQRRWVDHTITADPDRTRRLDPDDLVAAVTGLADRARPDLHRDRERRAVERDRVYCQDGFDGSSYGSWELGPESAELLRRALFDTNPNHHTTTRDNDRDATNDTGHDTGRQRADTGGDHSGDAAHDGDASDADGDVSDGDSAATVELEDEDGGEFTGADRWRHRREWTNAQALLALCRQRLGEPGGSAPPPARPSMLIIVDIDALTDNHPDGVGSATAQLVTRSTRGPVELTPAAAQRLACDATLRVVLVDGAIPLGATAAEPKVPATLRAVLVARDGGCRFPACRQPVDVCENHHVVPVATGGPTVLDNLVLLCLPHHHAVHDGGWTSRLHPDGTMIFTRRGITITSLPHRDKRFTPTTPPPTGRPTRPQRQRTAGDDHTDGDLQRDLADTGDDPDPPPEVAMPF